ncbi:DUF4244 domain-containing protein [Solihabitans fulvus]|uniref:DUF4244 domain-containing protein n=1 Tax=Solihabitans fulvus TaxID=1892852 RepID=A0A5B2XG72_9PSEU|nr:DUF4244 domain-containing protein [Solihabitans fulvus]KAA2262276.1 DUF4244 domain-containing protein [Solihabitans fulvus]
MMHGFRVRLAGLVRADEGMATVEYAIGMIAAAGLALLLVMVLRGDAVASALAGMVQRALSLPT